ncbi:MAG: glucose-1-phosphate cytidylyltransferase [Gemmatimonadetes bacterium]|nr:glucose-1-phosphate cytidylyltransferase [Gemmatimonadota bacterium]
MKTVILAGGLGSRLAEETVIRPKPMVEIGGRPVLWHIMNLYAAHGFNDFVVACGYKGEMIKEYFSNFHLHNADLCIRLRDGKVELHNNRGPDWRVTLVDTGFSTSTGGRIKRLGPWLENEPFMMTYGDGVGNVDIASIVEFHHRHKRLATITAVRPPARFGGIEFDGDRVVHFQEKPQIGEGWINGGFMVLQPEVLDYIEGDETLFEKDPLERLAADSELMAYRHDGFWQPMDTLREKHLLEELWASGEAPWKIWDD